MPLYIAFAVEFRIYHLILLCLHRGYPQAATTTDQAGCCIAEPALERCIRLCRSCCSHRSQIVKTRSKKTFGDEGVVLCLGITLPEPHQYDDLAKE